MRRRTLPLAALLGCAVACSAEAPPPAASEGEGPAPASPPAWEVTPAGAGPVRVGMTLAELLPHLDPATDTTTLSADCDYVRLPAAPDSLLVMIDRRRVARVDVVGGEIATREGARIGDAESRVVSLYPDARRLPHKYTDGSYLVALPGAPADTVHRLVFETDGHRVTRYRAGQLPQVEWVEGCA